MKPCWKAYCFCHEDQRWAGGSELPAGHSRKQETGGERRSGAKRRTSSRSCKGAVRDPKHSVRQPLVTCGSANPHGHVACPHRGARCLMMNIGDDTTDLPRPRCVNVRSMRLRWAKTTDPPVGSSIPASAPRDHGIRRLERRQAMFGPLVLDRTSFIIGTGAMGPEPPGAERVAQLLEWVGIAIFVALLVGAAVILVQNRKRG